jgi:anti-sigma factor RsiW
MMRWFGVNKHPEEDLSAYLDGELSSREASRLESHLSTCEHCGVLLEELRDVRSMLVSLPEFEPKRSFVLGAEYAAPRQAAAPSARPERRSPFVFAPAVALTLLVALVGIDLAGTTGNGGSRGDALTSMAGDMREAADDGALQRTTEQPRAPSSGAGAGAGAAETPASGALAPATGQESAPPSASPRAIEPFVAPGEKAEAEGAGVASSVEPAGDASGEATGGPSTLRLLQLLAASAFVSSLFWVAVRPRLVSRGDLT